MAKKRYHDKDSGYMVKNDPSQVANMPSETMIKLYPENPSYYPESYIDDSIHGVDKELKDMRNMKGLVKGMVE